MNRFDDILGECCMWVLRIIGVALILFVALSVVVGALMLVTR